MEAKEELVKDLGDDLGRAGLPDEHDKIIGRNYRFICFHGSHSCILVGTILAIEFSDEGGLELYVSNPTFWGAPLECLTYLGNSKSWAAAIARDKDLSENRFDNLTETQVEQKIEAELMARFFNGKLELF